MMLRLLPLALLPLAMAACTTGTNFPSLAPRPIETLPMAAPTEVIAPAVADPALDAAAAAQLALGEQGARGFDAALAAARAAFARSGAMANGSEAWLTAQQTLTALGAARDPVATALANLDAARLAAAQQDRAVDTHALDAAHARLTAIMAEEDGAYEELAARLPDG